MFLPISLALFLLFLFLIPFFFVFAPAVAFAKMGLDPFSGCVFFFFCLLGGSVNIPVIRKTGDCIPPPDDLAAFLHRYAGIRIPVCGQKILAVNLGGAILPGLLSLYLLKFVPLASVVLATTVTTVTAYLVSRPVKEIGIVMPPFVPPLVAALAAVIISRQHAPQLAYICGVIGTLVGADILRLSQMRQLGAPFMSIGGAGVFDGIYLVGIVSVLLA